MIPAISRQGPVMQTGGPRVGLVFREKEIEVRMLPMTPITEVMKTYTRKLLERDRSHDTTR